MKLSQCTMGVIIQSGDGYIGHVVGLTQSVDYPGSKSTEGEVIPLVKWSYKELPSGIHHTNIKLYKD